MRCKAAERWCKVAHHWNLVVLLHVLSKRKDLLNRKVEGMVDDELTAIHRRSHFVRERPFVRTRRVIDPQHFEFFS